MSERAHGKLKGASSKMITHWWFDGHTVDTLFWTLFPINPERVLPGDFVASWSDNPIAFSVGSYHPNGANFAFADGSVKFISETIDSWPIDPQRLEPVGVTGNYTNRYRLAKGTSFGVYQALSTRNGGEAASR